MVEADLRRAIAPTLHAFHTRVEFDDFVADTESGGLGGLTLFWRWVARWSNWIYLGAYTQAQIQAGGGMQAHAATLFTAWTAEQERRERERHEANTRADELARDVLTAVEYDQFRECGYVEVPSQKVRGMVYRVFGEGRTIVYDAHSVRPTLNPRSACVVVSPSVVPTDALVAKVLAVKYNEDRFWAVAQF